MFENPTKNYSKVIASTQILIYNLKCIYKCSRMNNINIQKIKSKFKVGGMKNEDKKV